MSGRYQPETMKKWQVLIPNHIGIHKSSFGVFPPDVLNTLDTPCISRDPSMCCITAYEVGHFCHEASQAATSFLWIIVPASTPTSWLAHSISLPNLKLISIWVILWISHEVGVLHIETSLRLGRDISGRDSSPLCHRPEEEFNPIPNSSWSKSWLRLVSVHITSDSPVKRPDGECQFVQDPLIVNKRPSPFIPWSWACTLYIFRYL